MKKERQKGGKVMIYKDYDISNDNQALPPPPFCFKCFI